MTSFKLQPKATVLNLSSTHGGRRKKFEWRLLGEDIFIKNEDSRIHLFNLSETLEVIQWLADKFGHGWFPLANNVALLGIGNEQDGLGTAILSVTPKDVTHAQGSSYLGVVIEEVGIFEWNGATKGIQWRIVRKPKSNSELQETFESYLKQKVDAPDDS